MNPKKDLKRFQPDPVFLINLEKQLKMDRRNARFSSYASALTLAASFALFLWISPQKSEPTTYENVDQNQTLVYLQEDFEATDENLEVLSSAKIFENDPFAQEDELIEELKMMY